MAHMLWLRRVVALIEYVRFMYIETLRMEWSMNNKFPHHILFPEKLPIYFEITGSQTVYRSVSF